MWEALIIDMLSIGIHKQTSYTGYTHSTWLRFGVLGSGSLVESKFCQYVLVEAEGYLKLLPPSILELCTLYFWPPKTINQ